MPQHSSTVLTADEIQQRLGSHSFIKRVFVFETIDSTNTYAKTIVASVNNEPTLIFAEEQTQGRGRFHRQWQSEKGKNLTFSLLVQLQITPECVGVLPLCVAVSVARAVETVAHVSVETKWPNDLLIDGKKFCGILLESVTSQKSTIIVGIGVNVHQQKFPSELNATSLNLASGKAVDRLQLLVHIVNNLQWLVALSLDSVVEKMFVGWKTRCRMLGKNIVVHIGTQVLSGVAKDISQDGALVLQIGDNEQKMYAGDVKVIKMEISVGNSSIKG